VKHKEGDGVGDEVGFSNCARVGFDFEIRGGA
jgi:hypothetical protein